MPRYTINNREVAAEEWISTPKENGIHRVYYNNGKIWCEASYYNEEEHGTFRGYDYNGQLQYEEYWVDGKEVLKEKEW